MSGILSKFAKPTGQYILFRIGNTKTKASTPDMNPILCATVVSKLNVATGGEFEFIDQVKLLTMFPEDGVFHLTDDLILKRFTQPTADELVKKLVG
jgi:hypothetical protein